jgi:hypothetical protein
LLNDIEKEVYITKKNGKIAHFCHYGESPKPKTDWSSFYSWKRMTVIITGLMLIILGLFFKYREVRMKGRV